jgi:hypothetical protein
MKTWESHIPTCVCEECERTGSGDFAVRAYFAGDESVLSRLSPTVARILPSLRVTAAKRNPLRAAHPRHAA